MRKKRFVLAVTVALLLAGLAVVISLRQRAGPEAARLLPDGDAILYSNVGRIRTIARIGQLASGSSASLASGAVSIDEPGYRQFVEDTGFQFERDLDEVAMTVHPLEFKKDARAAGNDKTSSKSSPAAASLEASVERDYRFSEVFAGRFDSQRMAAYLKKLSSGVERYGNNDIYIILHDGRTVRVAILNMDLVAASNLDNASVIHGMIDRFHHTALPVEAPALLRGYRSFLPATAMAWAVFKAASAPPREGDPGVLLPSPFREWMAGSVVVASVTPGTSLQLRGEIFTDNPEMARTKVNAANTYLSLYRAIASSVPTGGPDADVKALFQTIQVEQENERVVVQASVSPAFFKKLLKETAPQSATPDVPQPAPPSSPPSRQ